MKPLFLILLAAAYTGSHAQCLTDFTKLIPEPTIDYTQDFGRSVSMYDDYLAVGIPNNDSLGRITGIVKIYQKISEAWKYVATVSPSDPRDALQFGFAVKLSQDYLLVSAAGYRGKVYLFKKPVSGWISQTELTSFTVSNSANFGVGLNNPIDISADQQTIAIADQWYTASPLPQNYSGALFVYRKQPGFEWNGSVAPTIINAPEIDAADFGRGGVVIYGDRIITSTPYAPTANGRMYIFRDPSGEFLNPVLEAKLSSGSSAESSLFGFKNFVVTADGIFASAGVDINSNGKSHVIFFEKPPSGIWTDANRTCSIDPVGDGSNTNSSLTLATNGQDVYVSGANADGKGFFSVLKSSLNWCAAQPEIIETFTPSATQLMGNYGAVNAANQNTNAVIGFVPHPNNPSAQLALKILSRNASNGWDSQLIYPLKESTAGHRYGGTLLGFEDYLFVCAPNDNTVSANGGAVYMYKKNGATWLPNGKILPPLRGKYDDAFGTALATNGTQLAVGATGFEDYGRVFIYEKKNSDWSDVEMVQEIELPSDILTVFAYGDNLAMNKDWLLIPYVQNAPARVMLAIYKFNGSEWEYNQVLEIALANIFSKFTTLAVDIDDETIVAGNVIIERAETGEWEIRYILSPSDPEPIRISSDFTHWVSNGSMFGHQVDIADNSIFISAPTKDYGGIWDVGAIYVFTKRPWESWSSRTETAKILPRVKAERELFGYSVKVLGNTLIAGAPGSDYNKDGVTARNKPGRAYVFQSMDYFWQDVVPLVDFTGDSFVKDYFGIAVNLDETDFFIGASIEDIDNAKLSGSVYITPTPPILKLVPPVCSTEKTIDLFGYPFGGTWSGPGIVDEEEGIFDPAIAGLGEHEFTYKTRSCSHEGKLRILVEAPAEAKLNVAEEHLVCEDASLNIELEVQSQPGHSYLWYYRINAEQNFSPLNQQNADRMTATSRGEYRAKVYNTVCESLSPIVLIKNESVKLILEPIERICKDQGGIVLSAQPADGSWQGPGVSNNKLFTSSLRDGIYTLTYHYTSERGCLYDSATVAWIERIAVPVIKRASGDLCVQGEVTLSINPPYPTGIQYEWEWRGTGQLWYSALDIHTREIKVSERGAYQVSASDGKCKSISNFLSIEDNLLEVRMTPKETELKVCDGQSMELAVENIPGRTYDWFYSDTQGGQPIQLDASGANSYTVERSGYYYALVQAGLCTAETPHKAVIIFPEDHVLIPNVFTPNGDGLNDEFTIESNQDDLQFRIFNRYGQQLFSGGSDTPWTGDDMSAGVYFWSVIYHTCTGDFQKEKGTVHLVR